MSTTGRLSTDQRNAIKAGAPIRQVWKIYAPFDATHAAWSALTIDDGIFPSLTSENRRVLRAGSRKLEVWNPSPNVTINPKPLQYSFVVDNSDEKFYVGTADNFFEHPAGYQATPQECYVEHLLYVDTVGTYPGARVWSNITHMNYAGQVVSLRHENVAGPDGTPATTQTIITCEQIGAWASLRRTWTTDDATDHDMTDTGGGGINFIWTV